MRLNIILGIVILLRKGSLCEKFVRDKRVVSWAWTFRTSQKRRFYFTFCILNNPNLWWQLLFLFSWIWKKNLDSAQYVCDTLNAPRIYEGINNLMMILRFSLWFRAREWRQGVNGAHFALIFRDRPLETSQQKINCQTFLRTFDQIPLIRFHKPNIRTRTFGSWFFGAKVSSGRSFRMIESRDEMIKMDEKSEI